MTDIVVNVAAMSRAREDIAALAGDVESDAFYPDYKLRGAPIAEGGRDLFIADWENRSETELSGIEAMVLGFELVQRSFDEADRTLSNALDALDEINFQIEVGQ